MTHGTTALFRGYDPSMTRTASKIQQSYYAKTAGAYDAMHDGVDGGHSWAINHLVSLVERVEATSVLDVGTGTGRALKAVRKRCPGVRVHGIEPVPEMVAVAIERHGIPADGISEGSGDALDYPQDSFDIVCEFGVLHHVANPSTVVGEMLRVARRGIVISDNNRFGQGRPTARWGKLTLARAGLWQLAYRAIHRGKPYHLSEGDGLSYSYSPYDNLEQIAAWADEVQILAPGRPTGSWLHPLLTSPHVVLVAMRA